MVEDVDASVIRCITAVCCDETAADGPNVNLLEPSRRAQAEYEIDGSDSGIRQSHMNASCDLPLNVALSVYLPAFVGIDSILVAGDFACVETLVSLLCTECKSLAS